MKEKICEYLNWKGTEHPKASINYKLWLERVIEVCGEKPLEQYSVSDVVKYNSWLKTRYSPYCVKYAMTILKIFLHYCREVQNYRCLSPIAVPINKHTIAKSHRAIREEEYLKIISSIPTNEFTLLRDSLVIRMLWDTGVRVSELCDLDISHIDPRKHSAVINTKKTGNKRPIVWSEETHQLLLKYLPSRLELEKQNGTYALFVGKALDGGWTRRLTTRTAQRIVSSYAAKARITAKVTPHSFRHGWAHKRRDQRAPLSFIQKGLGHSSPISTFVYEQYNDPEFETCAESYLNTNNIMAIPGLVDNKLIGNIMAI